MSTILGPIWWWGHKLAQRYQIGVLADAVRRFRQALIDIRDESLCKSREKEIIDETVDFATATIHEIEANARGLVRLSERLLNLAETTTAQAENVAHNAEDTAGNTDSVSKPTMQVQEVMHGLMDRITSQGGLVADIVEKNRVSQSHVQELGQAVKEIDSIIALLDHAGI